MIIKGFIIGFLFSFSISAVCAALIDEAGALEECAVNVIATKQATNGILNNHLSALDDLELKHLATTKDAEEYKQDALKDVREMSGTIEKEVIEKEYTEEEINIYISNIEKDAEKEKENYVNKYNF